MDFYKDIVLPTIGENNGIVLFFDDEERLKALAATCTMKKTLLDKGGVLLVEVYDYPIAITLCFYGHDSIALGRMMQQFILAQRDTFIKVTCGMGIDPSVRVGSFVVATGAIGQSHAYTKMPVFYPSIADFDVTMQIQHVLEKQHCSYYSGVILSCETNEDHDLNALEEELMHSECLALDGDSAMLFDMGKMAHVRCASLLYIDKYPLRPYILQQHDEGFVDVLCTIMQQLSEE